MVVEGVDEIAAGAVVVVVEVVADWQKTERKKRRKQKATTTSIFIQEAVLLASFCCRYQGWCVPAARRGRRPTHANPNPGRPSSCCF